MRYDVFTHPPLPQHAAFPFAFRFQVGWVTLERSSKFYLLAAG